MRILPLLIVTIIPCAAQEPAMPAEPPHLDFPKSGADVVTGTAGGVRLAVRLKIFDAGGRVVAQRDVLVNAADSSFVAGFPAPLAAGEIVQASYLAGQTEMMPSAPLTVPLAAASMTSHALPASTPVRIRTGLVPGATNIMADATPTPANSNYEVRLLACPGAVAAGIRDSTGFRPYSVTDASGQAAITFEQPLAIGQSVSLCQKIVDKTDPSLPPLDAPNSGATAITEPLDLGRVRYRFTSGVILSNDGGFQLSPSETQAGLFLGLTADRSWFAPDAQGFRRLNLNTYLDVRLTSVATQQVIALAASSQNFTESQKAASLETGAYLPWIVGAPWQNGANTYSLFVAPLAKAGFVTLAGAASSATDVVPVTGSFFKSYSFGARLGVFQHFLSDSAAPDLISYVDFTTGRFGDFEAFRDLTLEANPNPPATEPHDFLLVRPWRYSIDGIFKVPHSPFVIGFSANLGSGAWPASRAAQGIHPFTQPRDDLRLLFGAQFDFSKFLRAVPQL